MLLVLALATTSQAIDLSAFGSCPGEVRISVGGATPGGQFAIMSSAETGAMAVPRGTCAGTVSGLADGARLRVARRRKEAKYAELLHC